MKIGGLCLLAFTGMALAGCATKLDQLETGLRASPSHEHRVKSGQSKELYSAYQIGDDCSWGSRSPSITIITPPKHGQASVVRRMGHTGFPASNPRYKCNDRMTPLTAVVYRSSPGFVGRDMVRFRTDFAGAIDNPPETIVEIIEVER